VDLGGAKEAQIQWNSAGGTTVHNFNCIWQVAPMYPMTLCRELCKDGWTNWFAVWVVESGGPKEAQVQLYSPGSANVLTWEGTLAPPGKYDWTAHLWRRCGLMSNYTDDLLLLLFLANVNSCSRSLYAIARPSVVCLLSVCRL